MIRIFVQFVIQVFFVGGQSQVPFAFLVPVIHHLSKNGERIVKKSHQIITAGSVVSDIFCNYLDRLMVTEKH